MLVEGGDVAEDVAFVLEKGAGPLDGFDDVRASLVDELAEMEEDGLGEGFGLGDVGVNFGSVWGISALLVSGEIQFSAKALFAGIGNAAEAGVAGEGEFAGAQGVGFEVGAVGGDEEPVVDLAAQRFDGANGWEGVTEGSGSVGRFGYIGEHYPEAVVFGLLEGVAEHEDDLVLDVDGVAGEHGADFRSEGFQGFQEEGVGRGFSLGGLCRHEGRIMHGLRAVRWRSGSFTSFRMTRFVVVRAEGIVLRTILVSRLLW